MRSNRCLNSGGPRTRHRLAPQLRHPVRQRGHQQVDRIPVRGNRRPHEILAGSASPENAAACASISASIARVEQACASAILAHITFKPPPIYQQPLAFCYPLLLPAF